MPARLFFNKKMKSVLNNIHKGETANSIWKDITIKFDEDSVDIIWKNSKFKFNPFDVWNIIILALKYEVNK